MTSQKGELEGNRYAYMWEREIRLLDESDCTVELVVQTHDIHGVQRVYYGDAPPIEAGDIQPGWEEEDG